MSEELREAIARQAQDWLEQPGARTTDLADALLSGPLAPLLAAQAAVERVEALCDSQDAIYPPIWVEQVRGALWGTM